MNKNKIKVIRIFSLVLLTGILGIIFYSALASAEFWICINKGEQINYCNNYKPPYTCDINSGCQKCMSVYNATANCYINGVWGQCVAEGQQCTNTGENGTGGVEIDVTPPVISYTSPLQDGLYVKRAVPLIFTINEKADVFYTDLDDGRGRWSRVCQECTSYGNSRSFSEGLNNIGFKIVDVVGNTAYENISFFIDSKKPRIYKTEPRSGFANGDFYVQFMEENPSLLNINYGNFITGFRNANVDLNTCVQDRTKTNCNINVDLDDYDGQEIDYFFNITDIASKYYQYRTNTVEVDKTAPVLNNINYTIVRTSVTFTFNVTENNFDVIEYMDNSDSRPTWRTMCSRLSNEICTKRITFREGEHDLSIQIADEAGNIVAENAVFTVTR